MGIFGFGVLRDRFASVVPHAAIARAGYVACFDVTPIVVYAIRHSTDENEFVELFRRRMESSKEVRFLRTNPPYALCYTLDNRAPLAKRQTQMQRLLDARPIVARLTTAAGATRGDDVVAKHNGGIIGASSPTSLRVKDVAFRIREILLRDFVLTVAATARRSRGNSGCNGDKGNNDTADHCYNGGAKRSKLAERRRRCRESDSCDDDDPASFARMNRIEFDYDEGEGEIKAMNWLSEHGGGKEGLLRLIMARDNDVFVYILSKLRKHCTMRTTSPSATPQLQYTTTSSSVTVGSWRLRGCGDRDHRADVGSGFDKIVIEPDSYLMYHEGSNDVLLCWRHLSAYYDKCWILLLWMSVCFGNDFAFGILDKSVTSVSYYYPLLEQHFINVNASFAALSYGDDVDEKGDRSRIVDATETTTTKKTTTIVAYLTEAFCELRNVLLRGRRGGDDTAATSELSSDDDYDDKTAADYDDYVRLWIARQLWSFFYILELPSEFTRNQRFRTCPTLCINASFDKPYMSNETFVHLRDTDFRRHIESVVLNGL